MTYFATINNFFIHIDLCPHITKNTNIFRETLQIAHYITPIFMKIINSNIIYAITIKYARYIIQNANKKKNIDIKGKYLKC